MTEILKSSGMDPTRSHETSESVRPHCLKWPFSHLRESEHGLTVTAFVSNFSPAQRRSAGLAFLGARLCDAEQVAYALASGEAWFPLPAPAPPWCSRCGSGLTLRTDRWCWGCESYDRYATDAVRPTATLDEPNRVVQPEQTTEVSNNAGVGSRTTAPPDRTSDAPLPVLQLHSANDHPLGPNCLCYRCRRWCWGIEFLGATLIGDGFDLVLAATEPYYKRFFAPPARIGFAKEDRVRDGTETTDPEERNS